MKQTLEKIDVGTFLFSEKLEITDPCYDRDVWCRINDVDCVPGCYTCTAYISDEGEWGRRVASISIQLNGEDLECDTYLGDIGVDAGLAGFFSNKPDYTDSEWSSFCDILYHSDEKAFVVDEGFFSESGYGDGCYGVYVHLADEKRIDAAEIVFIDEEMYLR